MNISFIHPEVSKEQFQKLECFIFLDIWSQRIVAKSRWCRILRREPFSTNIWNLKGICLWLLIFFEMSSIYQMVCHVFFSKRSITFIFKHFQYLSCIYSTAISKINALTFNVIYYFLYLFVFGETALDHSIETEMFLKKILSTLYCCLLCLVCIHGGLARFYKCQLEWHTFTAIKETHVPRMNWPTRCSDLNQIEHLRDMRP